MKRTASSRSSIDSSSSKTSADGNGIGWEASAIGEKKGYLHLLRDHTLDDIARLLVGDPMGRGPYLRKFLLDGTPPENLVLKAVIAEWLLANREPEVFVALLDLGPMSINLDNAQSATTLLEATRSMQSVSGLAIRIYSTQHHAFAGQILPLLVEAIKLNNGVDSLHISGRHYRKHGLSPLLDALGCVRNLKLTTTFGELCPDDVMLLAALVKKNREIQVLDLGFRVPDLLKGACHDPAPINFLLDGLRAQCGLKKLCVDRLPWECQSMLGELIGESHALTHLHIGLHGPDATEPLIAGLLRNTTLQKLALDIDSIEDGMLPLLALLAEKRCGPPEFAIETRNGRSDKSDSLYISEMIANDTAISTFTWRFREHRNVDLTLLGSALQLNSTLDTVILDKAGYLHSDVDIFKHWIDQEQLPDLVALLGENRTLTRFDFRFLNSVRSTFPEIQNILARNLSYQRYACSTGFMQGAAEGFFAALNMPSELGQPTAPYLSA